MPPEDTKTRSLRNRGALNPRPDDVADPLFEGNEFFDARDLVQVKYEMLRRVQVDGEPVSRAAAAFGVSRPTFYQAQSSLRSQGLPGLVPKKRGPRHAHKLTGEVMAFLDSERSSDASVPAKELAERVEHRFGVRIHARTIQRRLAERKKKRRTSPPSSNSAQ